MASQDIVCYFCCYVCESDLGHSLFTTRQRDGQSPSKMAVCSVEKNVGGQRHHASMVCHGERGLESLQFNWFCAAMRLYNSLTKSNSYTMNKVLHADMQLSTRSNDCWSAHILSAMDGLTQSYIFIQQTKTAKL